MSHSSTEQLSQLFREIEAEKGATGLTEFVIDTLDIALSSFQPKNVHDLFEQLRRLFGDVKATQPRIALVIYFFYDIWEELQKEKSDILTIDDFREAVRRTAERIKVENEQDFITIVRHGVEVIEPNDVILVHSHSGTIRRILTNAKREGKRFSVMLAEQEADKTIDNAEYLTENAIPFTVVPEYMLSHIMHDVTKVFYGATTLNYEQNFVCDAGTYSILAEFHEAGIPNYMFISSKKFSLWKSAVKHNTYKTTQKKAYTSKDKSIVYDRIKFSHDRVPAKLFNYVITEEGTFSPEEMHTVYKKRYAERKEMRKKFFSDETDDSAI